MRHNNLTDVAKRSTRNIIIIYVIIKQLIYVFAVGGTYWIPRGIAGLIMLALVFGITKTHRISDKMIAILAPFSMALTEIVLCALIGGDRMVYIFLIGCALMSLTYLDTKCLLVNMVLTIISVSAFVFIGRVGLMGSSYTIMDEIYGLISLVIIDLLVFFICRYSVGAFTQSKRTGQTFDTVLDTTPSYMVITNEKAKVEYISRALSEWLQISKREYALRRPLMDICRSKELKRVFQEAMESGGNIERNYELNIGGIHYWFLLRSSLMGTGKVARIFEFTNITPIMEAKNEAEAATKAKSSFLANMSHEIRTPMNAIIGMTELVMLKPLKSEQLEQMVAIKGAAMSLLHIINDILDFSKIDAEKMEVINKPFDFMSLINDTVNMINIKAEGSGIAFTACISKDLPARVDGDELRIKQALINILNNAVKFTKEGCVALNVTSEAMDDGFIKLKFIVSDTGIGIQKEELSKLFGAFSQLDTRKNRDIVGTGLGLSITRRLIELMGGSISVDSVYGKGSVFSFSIVCRNLNEGQIVSLAEPESYKALCFTPNKYYANVLSAMFDDLGVACSLCGELSEFEEKLLDGTYTHVFFYQTALPVVERRYDSQKNTRFVMIKGIRDAIPSMTVAFMNKPVLITSLVGALKGGTCENAAAGQHSEVKLGAFGTQDVRALLVDDNSVNLMVAEGMLRQYGIGVVTANGGQDGIDKIQTGAFDIVFMDHMMPGVDGIDATRAIRAFGGRFEKIPIIALSANAIMGVERTFLDAGMNGFISKPIVIKQLHDVLLGHLPPEKILLNHGETDG